MHFFFIDYQAKLKMKLVSSLMSHISMKPDIWPRVKNIVLIEFRHDHHLMLVFHTAMDWTVCLDLINQRAMLSSFNSFGIVCFGQMPFTDSTVFYSFFY